MSEIPPPAAGFAGPEFGLFAMTGIRPVFGGVVPYGQALRNMEEAQAQRREGNIPDTFFYLEHEPVITFGRSTPPEHLHATPHQIPTFEVPRGGMATYHGPGQLVGYCVIDLGRREGGLRPDIHAFLRALETGLCMFLRREFDLEAVALDGYTGVWIGPRKIASIGISVRRWVTAHGFALNVAPNMEAFRCINPCGLGDVEMTSMERELERAGRPIRIPRMKDLARCVHVYVSHALQAGGWCKGDPEVR